MATDTNMNNSVDMAAVIKESAIASLVAFGLAVVLVGLKVEDTSQGLELGSRWMWVVAAVISVFVGRFFFALQREKGVSTIPKKKEVLSGQETAGAGVHRFAMIAGPVFIVFAFILPSLPFADRYIVDVATYVLIYVMLGWGLNIVVGLAGLLDLGYVAFYAVGAYSYALFAHYFGFSFWICLPLAGLCAAAFGVILGIPVLRLRGDYLAIVTLGF
ncbi:MAG: DUF3382 domain-containing protein, partial [Aestuariibacter sp.]|nr:DUF3382 domain-containing protein [Aestuariibacter sp.]